MELADAERHGRAGRRPSERERASQTPFNYRHSLYVITLPHKLLVPQMPARKHSNCTIWL